MGQKSTTGSKSAVERTVRKGLFTTSMVVLLLSGCSAPYVSLLADVLSILQFVESHASAARVAKTEFSASERNGTEKIVLSPKQHGNATIPAGGVLRLELTGDDDGLTQLVIGATDGRLPKVDVQKGGLPLAYEAYFNLSGAIVYPLQLEDGETCSVFIADYYRREMEFQYEVV